MLKHILTFLVLALLFNSKSFCEELKIQLNFPKTSKSKTAEPKPRAKIETVSGNLTLDISPYPSAEKGRYLVEYFFNEEKIYETDGYPAGIDSKKMTFKYVIDTTKIPNGQYKLTVNYWDKKGASAIGIRKIVINNQN